MNRKKTSSQLRKYFALGDFPEIFILRNHSFPFSSKYQANYIKLHTHGISLKLKVFFPRETSRIKEIMKKSLEHCGEITAPC